MRYLNFFSAVTLGARSIYLDASSKKKIKADYHLQINRQRSCAKQCLSFSDKAVFIFFRQSKNDIFLLFFRQPDSLLHHLFYALWFLPCLWFEKLRVGKGTGNGSDRKNYCFKILGTAKSVLLNASWFTILPGRRGGLDDTGCRLNSLVQCVRSFGYRMWGIPLEDSDSVPGETGGKKQWGFAECWGLTWIWVLLVFALLPWTVPGETGGEKQWGCAECWGLTWIWVLLVSALLPWTVPV